jgi:HEAT repeat protein
VRRNAAQALGALRDPRAVEPLLQTLKDRTLTVRQRAIVALGRIKDPLALTALLEVLLANKRESYEASKAIKKFGKKALPEVAKAFERTNNQELMMLLIEMKYQGALDLILKLLESHELSQRLTAISELGKLGDKRAIHPLIGQLENNDPLIQAETVQALGKLRAIESIPALLNLLIDDELYGPRSSIYRAVTEAFQIFGGVTAEITNAFPGNYPPMFNMGGTTFSLPEALGLLGNRHSNELSEGVSRLVNNTPKEVDLPPGISSDLINKVFEDMSWKFGVLFADAKDARQERVKRLMELLQSDAPLRRAAAALSLPWYSDEGSLNVLQQATRDSDELVHRTATWALQALRKVILYRGQAGL